MALRLPTHAPRASPPDERAKGTTRTAAPSRPLPAVESGPRRAGGAGRRAGPRAGRGRAARIRRRRVDAYRLEGLVRCRRCPRLVRYREGEGAPRGPKALAGQRYWAKPVPGFGDPRATVLLLGLAPGFHGANRTGRPFTGDAAGEFMWPILARMGLANRPRSVSRDDGFRMRGLWITSAVKCAPPENRPAPEERASCLPYLAREIRALPRLRTIVALGRIAHDAAIDWLRIRAPSVRKCDAPFRHGARHAFPDAGIVILDCLHTSRRNTNTGRLTEAMFEKVVGDAAASLRD
ncbi:MAG: uracil-DNA glycosylase [Planctomycetes bacterium]|nr:uracil-DNA glycosylase [Planctomycetota bacterium]